MTIRNYITPQDVVDLLNEAISLDPGVGHLLSHQHPCNFKLAHHATIQVSCYPGDGDERPLVGIIGLLNGMFGICEDTGWGPIVRVVDEHGVTIRVKLSPDVYGDVEREETS